MNDLYDLLLPLHIQTGLTLIGLVCSTHWILSKTIQISRALWLYILVPIFGRRTNWRKEYGEWAVITGATDGIGKEFARQLASQGMNIILLSRTLSKLNTVAEEIVRDFSVRTKVIQVNFSEATLPTYRRIEDELSKYEIGLLINNVGVYFPHPMRLGQMDHSNIWDHVTVNMGATVLMTRTVISQMKGRGKGGIINISSGASTIPMPFIGSYSGTKVFVDYLSTTVRAEYEEFGVTVLNLNPFVLSTNMTQFYEAWATPSFFIPTAEKYVKSALHTFGRVESAVGYLPHAIEYAFITMLPGFLAKKFLYYLHKNVMTQTEGGKRH